MRTIILLLIGAGLLPGCGDCWSNARSGSCTSTEDPAPESCTEATTEAYDVLSTYCYGCHGKGGSVEGGMNFVLESDVLEARGLVDKGNPAGSTLYQRLSGGSMPPPGNPSPTESEIAAVEKWISCGAEPLYEQEERDFLGFDYIYEAAYSDLAAQPTVDQPFLRYVTLVHLYDAGVSDLMLDTYRVGLSKLLNSLSWYGSGAQDDYDQRIRNPTIVDERALVFRVDLRDYTWEATSSDPVDAWEYIVASDPYAFNLSDAFPGLESLRSATGSRGPIVNGDWLVKAASAPPLYNLILDLPDTQAEFLALFGVDQAANVANFNVVRVGLLDSGVSDFNRVFERHPAFYGYCWISYDFGSQEGAQNICRNPLTFEADGGEVICQLPNGLQAYYLANAAGDRLDLGPTGIVSDPNRDRADAGEDHEVLNGQSCMNCHYDGMIVRADEVAACAAESATDYNSIYEEIERLYSADAVAWLEQDQESFLAAMDQTRVPRVVENLETDLASDEFLVEGEPIFALVREFDRDMDKARVAAELGVPAEDLNIDALDSINNEDLTQLDVPGGTISRATFQALARDLLCLLHGDNDDFDFDAGACLPEITDPTCGDLDLACLEDQRCQIESFQPVDPNNEVEEQLVELGVCVACAESEVCGDGVDNECNGEVDDGCSEG